MIFQSQFWIINQIPFQEWSQRWFLIVIKYYYVRMITDSFHYDKGVYYSGNKTIHRNS